MTRPFGDCHDVRADAYGLGPEPVSGASKATNDLVRDQQDFVFVADALNFGPVRGRRYNHAPCPLNWLCDKGGNAVFPHRQDRGFQFLGARQPKVLGRCIAPLGPPVGLVDVVNVRDRHSALFVHRGHAPKRSGTDRRPVIRVLAADDDRLWSACLSSPSTCAPCGCWCRSPRTPIRQRTRWFKCARRQ